MSESTKIEQGKSKKLSYIHKYIHQKKKEEEEDEVDGMYVYITYARVYIHVRPPDSPMYINV